PPPPPCRRLHNACRSSSSPSALLECTEDTAPILIAPSSPEPKSERPAAIFQTCYVQLGRVLPDCERSRHSPRGVLVFESQYEPGNSFGVGALHRERRVREELADDRVFRSGLFGPDLLAPAQRAPVAQRHDHLARARFRKTRG